MNIEFYIMSTNDEIAAPMGTEAWDDTALLEVCARMHGFTNRHLNGLQQAIIMGRVTKKINRKFIRLFSNNLGQKLLLRRRRRQLYSFSIVW